MFVGVDLASKGPNPVSDKPTSDAIEIRLTPTQKEHYGRQTGLSLPSSLSLPLAELKLLSGVAAKAGSGFLPVWRSAVGQLLGRIPPTNGAAARSSSRSPSPRGRRSRSGGLPAASSPLC